MNWQRLRARLAVALAAVTMTAPLAPTFVRAQAPPDPFQVEISYVDVDTIVTDENGNFVGGLTKDDFELREDGKAQKIDTFSLVDIPVVRTGRFLLRDRPVTPDVRTNREPFRGRLYVILLDDLDVSPLRTNHVKRFAREFVEKRLGTNDLAAVTFTSRGTVGQDFTSDPTLLLAAIDRFVGRKLLPPNLDMLDQAYQRAASRSGMGEEDLTDVRTMGDKLNDRTTTGADLERGHRAITVLSTLKDVSDALASIRGRRKAVLLFSEGLDYPMTDVFGVGSGSDVLRSTEDAITAAARANVNYFTLDPRGLIGISPDFMEMTDRTALDKNPEPTPLEARKDLMAQVRISLDSLRALAEQTGGIAAVNSNDLESTYDRIVDRSSKYYVLGYYPPTHPRDGRFHTIDVRVKRPGLKVLARKGYASPRGKTPEERRRDDEARRARDAKKPLADNTTAELRDVLGSTMQQSGLTLSVQAAPFRNTKKDASVALAVEVDASRLSFAKQPNGTLANQLELSLFNLDETGKPHQGVRGVFDLSVRPENLDRLKSGGVRANTRVVLPAGRYQLRVGVRERQGGTAGSVFYDLLVPDFSKQAVTMSGMLLTAVSATQTFTAQADTTVAKLLPAPATSRREFDRSDTLALLVEIYDNGTMKSRHTIDAAIKLMDTAGRELFVARDAVDNETNWETYALTRQIALKDIPPGQYLLRVDAQLRGNPSDGPAAAESVITVK